MSDASAVFALLGPTNTGKTHRAIERMLEHASGMMGLPLRLLAREVYDKVVARVGVHHVALITGEEQIVPARPAYWIATVEAMPIEKQVEFLAVDEIQLAAHDGRGHVFTARILSARGTKETWFLGASTMRGVIQQLAPTAVHIEHPRLSTLTYAGCVPLKRLPPRSAVVAFSMPHVYEIAERLRTSKGGAAVVLGALSPRTRNAQVAMFQSGEVDWLVATDAIGMGLNLQVNHVAFASLRKFDGHAARDVDDAELAQIAGRAGRWIQNGSFGSITPHELPRETITAIEQHGFAPIRRVRWRNDDLDYASLASLVASLEQPPTRHVLMPMRDADDAQALRAVMHRDEVIRRARSPEAVELLWNTCSIPDFRKLLLDVHADFVARVFVELCDRGRLRDEWIAPAVQALDTTDGDIDALLARAAAIRTWTYVAHRSAWLDSPRYWQERTRALEDTLSDALHERLVMRFVDAHRAKRRHMPRRALGVERNEKQRTSSPIQTGTVDKCNTQLSKGTAPTELQDGGGHRGARGSASGANARPATEHPFASLERLRPLVARSTAAPAPKSVSNPDNVRTRGRSQPHEAPNPDAIANLVATLEDDNASTLAQASPSLAFSLNANGCITHSSSDMPDVRYIIARLGRGTSITQPAVHLSDPSSLNSHARELVMLHIDKLMRNVIATCVGDTCTRVLALAQAATTAEVQAALRGFAYRLRQGLGTLRCDEAIDLIRTLDDSMREKLHSAHISGGSAVWFVDPPLTSEVLVWRTGLARAWFRVAPVPARSSDALPCDANVKCFRPQKSTPRALYSAIGYPVFGPLAIRADVVEAIAREAYPKGESPVREPETFSAEGPRHAVGPTRQSTADPIAQVLSCTRDEANRIAASITHCRHSGDQR